MNTPKVFELIGAAFDGVAKPTISLRQFRLTDQKGMVGTITDEEWRAAGKERVDEDWQEIPDVEIEECDVVLAHMQAAEFQYYLPAYMCYAVRHVHLPMSKSDVIGMTVSALTPSRKNIGLRHYALAQYSMFTRAQREAIVAFLNFVAENAEAVQRPDAKKALGQEWTVTVVQNGFDTNIRVLPR
jgi:hypothetical protein